MASPTQWTWVWVNSGSWWWTGRPGVLQSMGLQRVRHDWATELNWMCVCTCAQLLSCVQLFVTPWTVPHQAPLSMGFSRQEYWSGLPFPSPGHLSDPGIESVILASPALARKFFTTESPGKPPCLWYSMVTLKWVLESMDSFRTASDLAVWVLQARVMANLVTRSLKNSNLCFLLIVYLSCFCKDFFAYSTLHAPITSLTVFCFWTFLVLIISVFWLLCCNHHSQFITPDISNYFTLKCKLSGKFVLQMIACNINTFTKCCHSMNKGNHLCSLLYVYPCCIFKPILHMCL